MATYRLGGFAVWSPLVLGLLLSLGCTGDAAPWCAERAGDADCDGTPDAHDRCDDTVRGALADAAGCSGAQKAGCEVRLAGPDDGAAADGHVDLTWEGTCDVYLVQGSDDPAFPAGATRMWARTTQRGLRVEATERYWRVVGGLEGRAAGYESEARELRWR